MAEQPAGPVSSGIPRAVELAWGWPHPAPAARVVA